jgi:hypothetical protein
VVERAWQPHWRAEVDGRQQATAVANLHRLAVPVAAGPHRVELWVERAPLHASLFVAAIAALALLALALRPRVR